MKLLINLALRNLLRQKRRNIMMGVTIALGMMLLVLSNSLTKGFSDLLLNKFMVHAFGHIQVTMTEKGNLQQSVFRDKDRIQKIIRENVKNLKEINEALASFTRVIGNGTAEQATLVGLVYNNDMENWFRNSAKEGIASDFTNQAKENPIVITAKKAEDLNVKLGDKVKMRVRTIYGQQQTARLTVAEITKNSSFFEDMTMYISLDKQKEMLGYKPYETGNMQIVLNKVDKPEEAAKEADKLHKALTPKVAYTLSEIGTLKMRMPGIVMGFYTNSNFIQLLTNNLSIKSKSTNWIYTTNQVLVSKILADEIGLKEGQSIVSIYDRKFGGKFTNNFIVAGTFEPGELDKYTVLANLQTFFKKYLENIPVRKDTPVTMALETTNMNVYPALVTEWKLMNRIKDFTGYMKKYSEMAKLNTDQPILDINTLYEMLSIILDLEGGINLIMFIVLLVLFLIILSGLINTLRMTIRERTREIGTIRAVGMQRNEVRVTFVLEVFFLAAAAAITGIIFAFLIMGGLSFWKIDTSSVLSIFLWEKHIYFMPSIGNIGAIIAMLLAFAGIAYIIKNFENFEAKQRWLWIVLGHIGFTAVQFALLSRNMIVMSIFAVLWILFTLFGSINVIRNTVKKIKPKKMPGYFLIQLVVLACCIYVLNAGVITSLLLILSITTVAAAFPANDGASMSAASALRHYE